MKKTLVLVVSLSAAWPAQAGPAAAPAFQALQQRLQAPAVDAGALGAAFDNSAAAPGAFQVESLPSPDPMSQRDLKQAMLQNLDVIHSAFAAQYGPGLYKGERTGWDLDRAIAQAKARVQAAPSITMEQYHQIVRDYFNSVKDYHVSVSFDATEASTLPFAVMGVGGRWYITAIDRSKLSEAAFPFHVGDELVGFGGRPTAAVVKDLQARLGSNAALTDRALASMLLTSRHAASAGGVAKGPVDVTVLPQGSAKAQTRSLVWDYTPELIRGPGLRAFDVPGVGPGRQRSPVDFMDDMLSPVQAQLGGPQAGNPFAIGGRDGFLPPLGETLWESEKDALFRAAVYKTADGRSVGFVRIPTYEVDDANAAVQEFAGLVKRFQASTDGLVIDETDNPGGSVFYLYALCSMLTDKPLSTPHHRIAITQDDVAQALQFLKTEPLVKSDDMAQKLLGPAQEGYPVDYEFYRRMLDYSRFILAQWNAGKTLTDPTWLDGVDQVNPSPAARYTKPLLVLINELDFSAGDFFPAIMQDNHRATLFGTRTAGAGGFVREVKFPNTMGIAGFSMTGSIAVRADGRPIENLGVTADVQYAPTAGDLQHGFAGYAAAVDAALARLLGGKGGAAAR